MVGNSSTVEVTHSVGYIPYCLVFWIMETDHTMQWT